MEMTASAQPGSGTPPVENRAAARVVAALVPAITNIRVSPHGTDAKLVNISATGLLAECGIRLKVGSAITLTFEGTFQPSSATAKVIRCAVAAMGKGGGLLYHVAVAFDAPIPLEVAGATPKPEPVAAMAEAVPVRAAVRNRW